VRYLWLITLFYAGILHAEFELNPEYAVLSRQALEMAQYHPDKARKLYRELALKLQAELEELESVPAHISYNLGNLWYHAGDLGRSMLWYRRSELQAPYSEMLKHNLNIVMEERLDELPKHFRPKWIPYSDEIVLLEPYLFWLLYLCLIVFLWSAAKNNGQRPESLKIKLLICAVVGLLWIAVYVLMEDRGDGVVIESEVVARKGNGLVFAPAFTHPLHEGTEVLKLEQRANWVYVQLTNGQRCWLPKRSLGWIR
jgi:hypothetical protein